eukprot:g7687.t1
MFELVLMRDMVRVDPSQFAQDRMSALVLEIDRKYCNKVLENVGLCVCFFEFDKVGDAQYFPGHGHAFTEVVFRLLVFRPFVNEVLLGQLVGMSEDGLQVSLGFFDAVHVPSFNLQVPSTFDRANARWVWTPPNSSDSDEPFDMRVGDRVRFQVANIKFTRTTRNPTGLTATSSELAVRDGGGGLNLGQPGMLRRRSSSVDFNAEAGEAEAAANRCCAMEIVGTMNENGLGLVSWWDGGGGEEVEEEEEDVAESG